MKYSRFRVGVLGIIWICSIALSLNGSLSHAGLAANDGEGLLNAVTLLKKSEHAEIGLKLLRELEDSAKDLSPKQFATQISKSVMLLQKLKKSCEDASLEPAKTAKLFEHAIRILNPGSNDDRFRTIETYSDFETNFNEGKMTRGILRSSSFLALAAIYTQLKGIKPKEWDLEIQFEIGKEETPESLMAYGRTLQDDSIDRLKRINERISAAKEIGVSVAEKLHQQEDQIRKIDSDRADIDDGLKRSNQVIKRINRNNQCCTIL